jgi:HAMP domain-containing protein
MNGALWGFAGVVISALASYLVARVSIRAQQRTADANKEVGAGQLALDIAKDADEKAKRAEAKADRVVGRLDKLEHWRRDVIDWWPSHKRRDDAVEYELNKLDPGAFRRLPAVPPFPPWNESN